MKKILFSPIGGTDPISNFRDGAMLHICRTYKPDEVYLYMSKEMLEYQRQDQRYTKVLEWLGEKIGQKFVIHTIEREHMKDVHIFDVFIEEFERELNDIMTKEKDAQIYVNVSSGTPAMKSSLQILSFMHSNLIAIQVATPEKGLNKMHENHEKYELKMQWDLNEDNNEDSYVDRCTVSKASKMMDRLTKDKIIKLLESYDYEAAGVLLDELVEKPCTEFHELLLVAQKRIILDLNSITKVWKVLPSDLFPVKEGDKINQFEYLLALIIKAKKKEYADFVRGITPLTTDLMEKVMVKCCDIKTSDFADRKKNGAYKISSCKVDKNERVKRAFMAEFSNISEREVTSVQFKAIIVYTTTDSKLAELVTEIRSVETNIRNMAAHQIVSVTDDFIEKQTGFTVNQIIDKLKQLMIYSGIKVKKENWQVYDDMNKKLIELL